ncbi:nuclear transport factor 2 family protein [Tamlana sp. 2201CG12-4]|uniref:nuclear transport factor 2 family protein n=1 Tax=Tamlana sp. 2201CG12-4 TaxID=3112582 RepID=UPI002DBD0250|nr:nuclear transport factor 2 family protein [Tamlana sp. 2201CG12-4]MEC3908433.1 nuclear transport factor 2 family protein [Tamlana sp. 2201CG12-4]
MSTQDVANKWAQMCREGKNLECIDELYADNVTSKEMPGVPYGEFVAGKQNVWDKSKQWLDNVVEFHSGEISDPVVADNHFTSKMSFDVTFKDRGRQQMEEVCVFEVNSGKIVNEQFFYTL